MTRHGLYHRARLCMSRMYSKVDYSTSSSRPKRSGIFVKLPCKKRITVGLLLSKSFSTGHCLTISLSSSRLSRISIPVANQKPRGFCNAMQCMNSKLQHSCTYSTTSLHHRFYSTISVTSDMIEHAFSKQNKERVTRDLKAMRPNKALISSCSEEAAVLVPFCLVNNKPSLLFTLRSSSLYKHRGEVSFPGGKRDKEDKTLVDTAIRETVEELGIDSDKIDIWGPLTPMPDRFGKIAISPVLAYLGEIDIENIPFNHHEVSEVFCMSLSHALENRRYTRYKSQSIHATFVNGPHRVWGFTAIVTDITFKILFPGNYEIISKPSRNIKSMTESRKT